MKSLTYHLLATMLVGSFSLSQVSCQNTNRRPERHLIPEEYVGWVRVDFGVKAAAPLPVEDGYYLLKIPASGYLQTSTEISYGWAADEYYYYSMGKRTRLPVTGWGSGGLIWGESDGWSGATYETRTATFEHFFVGTEDQFRKYAELRNEDGQPKLGNLHSDNSPP